MEWLMVDGELNTAMNDPLVNIGGGTTEIGLAKMHVVCKAH